MTKKVLFIEYCADDFLGGTVNMDPLTELVYRRICDMIYSTNDDLLDNDSLQYSTKAGAKWKKIRQELIEVHKKIYVENGRIRQRKCTEKIEKSRKNIEQKSEAGKASSEVRKSLKENKTTSTAVGTPVGTAVPTNQKPNNQLKKNIAKPAGKKPPDPNPENPVWFEGGVIRLRKRDYEHWLNRYSGSNDQFHNWLANRDDWYAEQSPEIRKNWFIATSNALQKLEYA